MRTEEDTEPMRARGIDVRPSPRAALLLVSAERAFRHRSAMSYLMTVDVTVARRLMALAPETMSLTGFITVSVARAAAEHPVVHSYRDWRGRLVTHHHVDVMVPVDTSTEYGPRVMPHIVTNADTRGVAEVSEALSAAEDTPARGILDGFPRLAGVPGLARVAYTILDRSVRLRQRVGTVLVATTGMHDIGQTFGVTAPTLMPLQVVIGSVARGPHSTGHHGECREVLNLTVTFDRGIVSSAQAARFATRLCTAVEHAEALQGQTGAEPLRQPAVPLVEQATQPAIRDADGLRNDRIVAAVDISPNGTGQRLPPRRDRSESTGPA
jgi:hypothetical protein